MHFPEACNNIVVIIKSEIWLFILFIICFAGDLLLKCGSDKKWWPRRVLIRGGQLLVSSGHHCPDGPNSLRLPLRHLSLQAGPLPNSLSLCRGQHIVLTLQVCKNCEKFTTDFLSKSVEKSL